MKNPIDATIRNVKASKSRDDKLDARIKKLEDEVKKLKLLMFGHGLYVMPKKKR